MTINWINPAPEKRTHFDRFISHFDGIKTYQLFHDKKDKRCSARILHEPTQTELLSYNQKGYGIYLTVNETNGKGRTKKDIVRIRAVFADFDDIPEGEEYFNLAPVMEFNPHLVVQSSLGKFHAYWFCTDVPVVSFADIQNSIIEMFGADKACKDESRVLRVPGFYHQKQSPQPVCVVHEHDYPAISFDDLRVVFPPVKREVWSSKRYKKTTQDGKYNGQWGTGKGNRNVELAKVIGIMIKEQMPWGDVESDAHKWGSACNPPLKTREIEHTLRSLRRYA